MTFISVRRPPPPATCPVSFRDETERQKAEMTLLGCYNSSHLAGLSLSSKLTLGSTLEEAC